MTTTQDTPQTRLVTTQTAATAVSVSERTIRRFLADGKLTRYTVPGTRSVRVSLEELYALFGIES